MIKPIPLLKDSPKVIEVIDSELTYQNQTPPERADNKDYGVAGQIVALLDYTDEARKNWTRSNNEIEALHSLRKCAAIAIRALILYGAFPRE